MHLRILRHFWKQINFDGCRAGGFQSGQEPCIPKDLFDSDEETDAEASDDNEDEDDIDGEEIEAYQNPCFDFMLCSLISLTI